MANLTRARTEWPSCRLLKHWGVRWICQFAVSAPPKKNLGGPSSLGTSCGDVGKQQKRVKKLRPPRKEKDSLCKRSTKVLGLEKTGRRNEI